MNLRGALRLLQLVTEKFPPPEGTRHGLTWGGGDEFQLTLSLHDGRQPVNIEPSDLDRTPEGIFNEIVRYMAASECKGVIPDTFIACGEGGNFCSDICREASLL